MVAEIVLAGGPVSAGTPKAGLAYLHPAGAVGPVTLDWGDGSPPESLSFDGTGSPLTMAHTFPARGTYTVTAVVDGNTTTRPVAVR